MGKGARLHFDHPVIEAELGFPAVLLVEAASGARNTHRTPEGGDCHVSANVKKAFGSMHNRKEKADHRQIDVPVGNRLVARLYDADHGNERNEKPEPSGEQPGVAPERAAHCNGNQYNRQECQSDLP